MRQTANAGAVSAECCIISPFMHNFDLPEYDSFDIGRRGRTPVSLDEAIREADAMRKTDPNSVSRVVPANANADSFYVQSVDRETAQAEILARFNARLTRMPAKNKARGG